MSPLRSLLQPFTAAYRKGRGSTDVHFLPMSSVLVSRRHVLLGGAAAAAAVAAVPAFTALDARQNSVDPRSFGAKGDGSSDDTKAVSEALAFASQRQLPIDGSGLLYAVSGTIMVSNRTGPWIRSLRLRQSRPAEERKTLFFSNCEQIRIDQLQIDVGTAGSIGYFNASGGLWIDGGSNHNISNVEAFGAGKNSLVAIWNTRNSTYTNLSVHDARFNDPHATDDVLQGIFLCRNSGCVVRSPIVFNLSGNANLRFPARFTRGLVLCGNKSVSIVDAQISDVDQGIDLTGSDGNRHCEILRARVSRCNSVGVKLANSAVDCSVTDSIADRCGLMGFFASGPSEAGLPFKTQNCDFVRCRSYDAGYNGFFDSAPHAGFRVERSRFDPDYPMGIRFIECEAIDRQSTPTMEYGFYEDVRPTCQPRQPNQLIDCQSSGHKRAMEYGIWTRTQARCPAHA